MWRRVFLIAAMLKLEASNIKLTLDDHVNVEKLYQPLLKVHQVITYLKKEEV